MDAIMTLCADKNIPMIEDAAHSLGTTWNGQNIGRFGQIGCFSFQSYKLVNAGEGGIMISDDPDLIARAVIMSGAYEHNWKKHDTLQMAFARWQNKLPLYNLRLQNLSAAVIRPQLAEIPRRVRDGRENHDYVADRLNQSPFLSVPAPLPSETRAPDSIQFNLVGLSEAEVASFVKSADSAGVKVQVFGLSKDNARAYWNWQFLDSLPDLPQTKAMLMRACDVRLPARLKRSELDFIADALLAAVETATAPS
jgi:dTDP-4-amino-4,6-dideoxygalactose transaminase